MKRAFIIICAALFAIQSSAAIAALPAQNLLKGSSSTIDVDYEIGDVAIADPKVCDYVIGKSRKQIYLNARAAGRTTLTMWDAGGTKRDEVTITVFTTTVSEVLRKVKDQFGSLEGILAAAAPGGEHGSLKQKMRDKLEDHAEDARLAQSLVRLQTDLDLGLNLRELRYGG